LDTLDVLSVFDDSNLIKILIISRLVTKIFFKNV